MESHFKLHEYSTILVVEVLVEKFDFFELSEASAYLRNILEKRHYPSMVFDFSRVSFIDSSVFGFLLEIHSSTKKNGNEIAVVCIDNSVLHVMTMLKLTDIIKVFQSREKAGEYLNIKLNL
jgi:Anti-anti-sigma regulatory factor (antagonist of anti-sigma factor)